MRSTDLLIALLGEGWSIQKVRNELGKITLLMEKQNRPG